MTKINIQTSGGAGPLASGNLQIKNGLPIDATLQIVSDVDGNDSVLKISTEDVTNNGGGGIMSNTAFGDNALIDNTTGSSNTSIGQATLRDNTTGVSNTAIGHESLRLNITGSNNTALGRNGLFDLSSGSNNTSVGQDTGRGITTGSNNTILGAGVTGLSATLANNIIIADGQGNRRINVDGTGNVGIGTTTPSTVLDVVGSDFMIFANNASGNRIVKIGTLPSVGEPAIQATLSNGTARQLSINPLGGNVGIGTSAPAAKLDIVSTVAGSEGLRVDGAGGGFAFVVKGGSDYTSHIRAGATIGANYFTTPPSNGLIVEGNVGIGTSAPGTPIDVVSAANGIIRVKGGTGVNQGGSFFVQAANSTNTLAGFGDRARFFGGTPDLLVSCTSVVPLTFDVGGAERMRVLTAGGLTFNGDTAQANALDDYEEGTFTPIIAGSSTAGTASYISQVGIYTKIGRIVNFSITINYNSGTGTGNLLIGGLPFTSLAAGANSSMSIGAFGNISLTALHIATAIVPNNNVVIAFEQYSTGGSASIPIPFDAAGVILISGTYTT